MPESFISSSDTANSAQLNWKDYFSDPYLATLIDTALIHNQELNITQQQIEIARYEIGARKGEYLPFLNLGAGAGLAKTPRYTPEGANEATTNIKPGTTMPDPVSDFLLGGFASWEIDIWNKLHNAKDAAVAEYLASVEGQNFMITNLVAEIANAYYELLALDKQLEIVESNIALQSSALAIIKQQKLASRVTELAVRRFQAQVLKTKSLQYTIRQRITETENHLNLLVGRYPQPINRPVLEFIDLPIDTIYAGIPSQMLQQRPDIRQSERELVAAKLNVKVARAQFYPSLEITAGAGYQAYSSALIFQTPQSLLYSFAGDLSAPLLNRKGIKAAYQSANTRQIQAMFDYEQTVLNAFVEISNQLAMIENLKQTYRLKAQEVEALNQSVIISNNLFQSARANYMEVLLTQREALDSKFELIETKMKQMKARVNIYQALGGGWQ